jgi:hypothetical protein
VLYVSNLEARNYVRFDGPGELSQGETVTGHFGENRITVIEGEVKPRHLNKHIDYTRFPGTPQENARSLATPADTAVSHDGSTLYVAAFGSATVDIFDCRHQGRAIRVPLNSLGPPPLSWMQFAVFGTKVSSSSCRSGSALARRSHWRKRPRQRRSCGRGRRLQGLQRRLREPARAHVALTDEEMRSFTDFALQLIPPPNPIRSLDYSLDESQSRSGTFSPCALGSQERNDVAHFLLSYESDFAPIVGQQITLDAASYAAHVDRGPARRSPSPACRRAPASASASIATRMAPWIATSSMRARALPIQRISGEGRRVSDVRGA